MLARQQKNMIEFFLMHHVAPMVASISRMSELINGILKKRVNPRQKYNYTCSKLLVNFFPPLEKSCILPVLFLDEKMRRLSKNFSANIQNLSHFPALLHQIIASQNTRTCLFDAGCPLMCKNDSLFLFL